MSDAVSARDVAVLRDLAARVADIAALPIQAERIRLLEASNSLRPLRPIVLWQGLQACWNEVIPPSSLRCGDPLLRGWERALRELVFRHEHVPADNPITATLFVDKTVRVGDLGLVTEFIGEENRRNNAGSYRWDPPLREPADVRSLRFPDIAYDSAATDRHLAVAADVFGDLLEVTPRLRLRWSYGLTEHLIYLRGFERSLLDLYDNPALIHQLMAFLRDEALYELEFYEREGLLTLNNGPADVITNGLGATDDLPAADFGGRVRLRDLWVMAESQEFTNVGPAQFAEFVLPYQLPVIERFGLCAYGCCEPLDTKFDLIIDRVPNLRRVSVSPWADRRLAAERLRDRFVYSWKPNPSRICAIVPDFEAAEADVKETLEVAQDCCLQISLNDTPTFHGEPGRLTRWVQMIRAHIGAGPNA